MKFALNSILTFILLSGAVSFAQTNANCVKLLSDAPKRQLENIKELKIWQGNVENWFALKGAFARVSATELTAIAGKGPKPKSEEDRQRIRDMFFAANPDVAVIEEIENIDALRELGGDTYEAFLVEGNDPRGIDIGMLIKKDLPLIVEYRTNKNMLWDDPIEQKKIPLFSRDLPISILRREDTSAPIMVVIGNHAKSKRSRPDFHEHHPHSTPPAAIDQQSYLWREAQYQAAAKIVSQLEAEFGENMPIIMAGDFNTEVDFSPEVFPLWNYMRDGFDMAQKTPKQGHRITQTFHPRGRRTQYSQLDGILGNSALQNSFLKMEILRYKDKAGNLIPIPTTYDEREKDPSDHFFVVATLDAQPIITQTLKSLPFKVKAPPAYIAPPQRDRQDTHCPPGADCTQIKPVIDYVKGVNQNSP